MSQTAFDSPIVITGASGFIGKNLILRLREAGYTDIRTLDRRTGVEEASRIIAGAKIIYHLAGVNRPTRESEFEDGNVNFTDHVLLAALRCGSAPEIVLTSSAQAGTNDSPYAVSKRKAEQAVKDYGDRTGSKVYIYRLPNVFGKWSKPHYNSFVATFCQQISNGEAPTIHDRTAPVSLAYIDDVCGELLSILALRPLGGYRVVPNVYDTSVGGVADILLSFQASRSSLITGGTGSGLVRALHATYLSFLDPADFTYTVPTYEDARGLFCEILKTENSGQVSFFTSKPGVTRGDHYHHTKTEKFLVVVGKARFDFVSVNDGRRASIEVDAASAKIVETIPGWAHSVTNIGESELVSMLWANEIFERASPDTFHYEV